MFGISCSPVLCVVYTPQPLLTLLRMRQARESLDSELFFPGYIAVERERERESLLTGTVIALPDFQTRFDTGSNRSASRWILLKWIFQSYDMMVWTDFIWLRIRSTVKSCGKRNTL